MIDLFLLSLIWKNVDNNFNFHDLDNILDTGDVNKAFNNFSNKSRW